MNDEIWKDVPGFEGRYQVSDQGRVRSVDRLVEVRTRWGGTAIRAFNGVVLTPQKINSGYMVVHLHRGSRRDRSVWLVHRLVAIAFCNLGEGQEPNHEDFDKTNNVATNLVPMTRKENVAHAIAGGRRPVKRRKAVRGRPVDGGEWVVFPSQLAAEIAMVGRASSAIHHCIIGVKKSAYGHVWERV